MSRQYTVRAKTLDAAMKFAKDHFGADAIVVETKEVMRRDKEGMGIRPQIELTVMPTRPISGQDVLRAGNAGLEVRPRSAAPTENIRRIQDDIERIERLIHSVESASTKLRTVSPGYPLNDALISGGVSPDALRAVQSAYHDSGGRDGDMASAQRHLLRALACSKAQALSQVSGPHLFMGSAGSGKTSLVIKLAAELVHMGHSPAIVVAAPFHSGDVRRVEEAASALMIEAVVARDFEELERCLSLYADKDLVLIDTPCVLSKKSPEIADFFERLREYDALFKHYVLSMTNASEFTLSELDLYRRWKCDYVAVSKVDLARRCGALVDIVMDHAVTFSFLSYEEENGAGLALARPETLAALVSHQITDDMNVNETEGGV